MTACRDIGLSGRTCCGGSSGAAVVNVEIV